MHRPFTIYKEEELKITKKRMNKSTLIKNSEETGNLSTQQWTNYQDGTSYIFFKLKKIYLSQK